MKCIVVTPEKTLVDEDAKFIVAPLYDGEYGIDADHAPVVGRLGVGEMRLTLTSDAVQYWFIDGGILEVVDTLNAHFTCNIFFKGYDEAQAKIKLAQKAPKEILHVDEGSFFDNLTAGIANSGVYFAVETFDKDGNVITMPADKYFTQIDMNSFQELMTEKFNNMFAEVLAPLFGVDPDEFDLTDLIMGKADSYMARKGYK